MVGVPFKVCIPSGDQIGVVAHSLAHLVDILRNRIGLAGKLRITLEDGTLVCDQDYFELLPHQTKLTVQQVESSTSPQRPADQSRPLALERRLSDACIGEKRALDDHDPLPSPAKHARVDSTPPQIIALNTNSNNSRPCTGSGDVAGLQISTVIGNVTMSPQILSPPPPQPKSPSPSTTLHHGHNRINTSPVVNSSCVNRPPFQHLSVAPVQPDIHHMSTMNRQLVPHHTHQHVQMMPSHRPQIAQKLPPIPTIQSPPHLPLIQQQQHPQLRSVAPELLCNQQTIHQCENPLPFFAQPRIIHQQSNVRMIQHQQNIVQQHQVTANSQQQVRSQCRYERILHQPHLLQPLCRPYEVINAYSQPVLPPASAQPAAQPLSNESLQAMLATLNTNIQPILSIPQIRPSVPPQPLPTSQPSLAQPVNQPSPAVINQPSPVVSQPSLVVANPAVNIQSPIPTLQIQPRVAAVERVSTPTGRLEESEDEDALCIDETAEADREESSSTPTSSDLSKPSVGSDDPLTTQDEKDSNCTQKPHNQSKGANDECSQSREPDQTAQATSVVRPKEPPALIKINVNSREGEEAFTPVDDGYFSSNTTPSDDVRNRLPFANFETTNPTEVDLTINSTEVSWTCDENMAETEGEHSSTPQETLNLPPGDAQKPIADVVDNTVSSEELMCESLLVKYPRSYHETRHSNRLASSDVSCNQLASSLDSTTTNDTVHQDQDCDNGENNVDELVVCLHTTCINGQVYITSAKYKTSALDNNDEKISFNLDSEPEESELGDSSPVLEPELDEWELDTELADSRSEGTNTPESSKAHEGAGRTPDEDSPTVEIADYGCERVIHSQPLLCSIEDVERCVAELVGVTLEEQQHQAELHCAQVNDNKQLCETECTDTVEQSVLLDSSTLLSSTDSQEDYVSLDCLLYEEEVPLGENCCVSVEPEIYHFEDEGCNEVTISLCDSEPDDMSLSEVLLDEEIETEVVEMDYDFQTSSLSMEEYHIRYPNMKYFTPVMESV